MGSEEKKKDFWESRKLAKIMELYVLNCIPKVRKGRREASSNTVDVGSGPNIGPGCFV